MIVCLELGGKLANDQNFPNRKSGCAALDMAYVASGRFDVYYQKSKFVG